MPMEGFEQKFPIIPSTYRHPRYSARNRGERTMALYRGLGVLTSLSSVSNT